MAKIFYWMADSPVPSGGEKNSYDHVNILNTSGFDAYAVHLKGQRYASLDSRTRVLCGDAFWDEFDASADYIVVPEGLGVLIGGLPGKKVIFNKNIYYGFQCLDTQPPVHKYPYT